MGGPERFLGRAEIPNTFEHFRVGICFCLFLYCQVSGCVASASVACHPRLQVDWATWLETSEFGQNIRWNAENNHGTNYHLHYLGLLIHLGRDTEASECALLASLKGLQRKFCGLFAEV